MKFCTKHEIPRDNAGRCASCLYEITGGLNSGYSPAPLTLDGLRRTVNYLRGETPDGARPCFECPVCQGTGLRGPSPCDGCGGKGRIG